MIFALSISPVPARSRLSLKLIDLINEPPVSHIIEKKCNKYENPFSNKRGIHQP